MIPTPRRRFAVAFLLTVALALATAAPALAATPSTEGPPSWVETTLAWFARLVDDSILTRFIGTDATGPYLDPDGSDAAPPVQPAGDGDVSSYTPPDDDGETGPYLDPNG